jgi:hypothetical protein
MCVCVCVRVCVCCVCVYIYIYKYDISSAKRIKKNTTCPALNPKPSNPNLNPEPKTLDPYIDMHRCMCKYYIYMYLCPEP